VEAIVGVRQFDLRFEGEANHAGTTPMSLRRDAVRGLARFMQDLDAAFAPIVTERTVWTLGRIVVEPNESSIIPQTATVTVQIRDAETRCLDCMASLTEEVARAAAADLGLSLQRSGDWNLDPTPMDARLAGALALAAETIAPGRWCRMTSGALHDASNVAAVLPSVMLFVPSLGGISHNPREDTQEDDLRLGLEVLSSFLASC
jgi:N-carbamoyl-L-amino-acid hydrolase